MGIRFEMWNVGSLKTVERELVKYKLDLVGMQEVLWDEVGTES
jgi:mRNA deadenylase 3'-5' endonuclease subunit Ccr4